ncbi:hypothetical protein [Streptomyces sp. CC224B]|uniref:hypothetical protein n=1 Tax=Streptomyces sp. CC224B TaxID=3044571 RepID=UPI0024A8A318|nr:hypothetical protein [Streptomyces sp. CC224B]
MDTRTTPPAPPAPTVPPVFELRVGGLRLTIQRVPYRLLTLAAAVGGPLAGATWFAR